MAIQLIQKILIQIQISRNILRSDMMLFSRSRAVPIAQILQLNTKDTPTLEHPTFEETE